MATPEEAARAAGRERGLRTVRAWTWTAGLAGAGLTAVLAVVAAASFAGHQASAAAPTVAATDPGAGTDNSVQPVPQTLPPDSFGSSNQPPAAISGGS